jgi:hypothetical protein
LPSLKRAAAIVGCDVSFQRCESVETALHRRARRLTNATETLTSNQPTNQVDCFLVTFFFFVLSSSVQ